jgi:hypothetical protein
MSKRKTQFMALLTAVSLVAPMAASAQQGRPPAPPVAEMAAAMGVSEVSLKGCMPEPGMGQKSGQKSGQKAEKPKGKPEGQAKGQPPRPDASAIASCLKTENPGITTAAVDKALQEFAPPPPRN